MPEAGTDKAVIGQLIIQTGTEDWLNRYFCTEYLGISFTQVVVYTVVFGTHTGRYAQAVEETLVVLEEEGGIVAVMVTGGDGCAAHVLVSGTRSDLCSVVPFLIELVVYIIGIVLIDADRIGFRFDRIR